jgi:Mg2+ and Co2+ transporter CorA
MPMAGPDQKMGMDYNELLLRNLDAIDQSLTSVKKSVDGLEKNFNQHRFDTKLEIQGLRDQISKVHQATLGNEERINDIHSATSANTVDINKAKGGYEFVKNFTKIITFLTAVSAFFLWIWNSFKNLTLKL